MRVSIIIFILLSAISFFGATSDAVYFTYIAKPQGLSDNNVECIFRDSDGFMWFGTRNGLCRFDGYEIKIYRKNENGNSISGNRILDIAEDKNGYLWVGTYKDGLNRFNKKTEKFEHFGLEQGIGQRINRIKVLKDSTIWVGSNIGVIRIKNLRDTIEIIPFRDDSNWQSTYDILETRNNGVYIATENLLIQKLNNETQKFEDIEYKRRADLASNYRKRLIEDNHGIIWITASYHGLCSYDPKTGQSEIYSAETNNLSTNVLMGSMDIDQNGNLWICTEENGINIFNIEDKTFKHIKRDNNQEGSLNSDHTYTVYFDDQNILWVGTFDKGINVFNPYQKKFNSSLFESNDLSILNGSSVLDIFEDSKQRVWIGTDGNGLFRFEHSKEPIHYKRNDSYDLLTANIITALGEDPLGNILIGTYTGGLISYSPDTEKRQQFYSDFNGKKLSSPHVWEIFNDSKDRIWLGLLAFGVDRFFFNDGTFINYGPYSGQTNKIDFYNVMVIEEDSDGDVWFGTEGKGIFILDSETNTIQRIQNDSLSNFTTDGIIKSMLHDKWGNVWIGTEDNGLYTYDKKRGAFTQYNKTNGFTSSPVQSLSEDNNGNIWIGTTSGLFNFNTVTLNFSKYIVEDGLSSNDFNPDAMVKLRDGRIITGTNNGADIISSEKIELNENLPKMIFTKLIVLNQEVSPNTIVNGRVILNESINYTNSLKLNWKDKAFSLEFAALNYTLPQKCLYKYKLEGFDEEWFYTNSDRRIASYSNLDPGKYTLKIVASNNDGKWGDNERSLIIHIMPPFWNTLLFKMFIVLLFGFTVYLIYKQRINKHKEQFKQSQLEQERKIIALENENLEAELQKLAFSIISKNKLLVEQKNRILNLSNKARENVKEGLQKIVDYIDEDLDEEKDWNFIEPQIDKAYNHFITHLKEKHPDLSSNEIRIAAYIRMNLSTKEICEFMNKTQRAVENDRYRLRKKIGLESNDSIKDHLMNL